MLAYVLALVIGLGSLAMYMAAFFFPEVHRKNDLIWSGVGLFYAWVLWVCAGRITGGVLLGQLASVVLLGWFAFSTFTLRRELASPDQQTPIPAELPSSFQGLLSKFTGLFKKGKSDSEIVASAKAAAAAKQAEIQPQEVAKPTPTVEIVDKRETPTEVAQPSPTTEEVTIHEPETENKSDTSTEAQELVPPTPPEPELVEAAQKSASSDIKSTEDAAIPVEAIAPEVELAPPAEPTGKGDPEDRIVESDSTNAPNL